MFITQASLQVIAPSYVYKTAISSDRAARKILFGMCCRKRPLETSSASKDNIKVGLTYMSYNEVVQ